MPSFITTNEIAKRLYKGYIGLWPRIPVVSVFKVDDSRFGKVNFDFNDPGDSDRDEMFSFSVLMSYTSESGEELILSVRELMRMSNHAVEHFSDIINDLYRAS